MPSMDNRLPATIPKEGFYDMPHLLTTSYAETPAYTLRNPENDIWNLEPLQHRLYDITNQQLRSIDQTGPSPQQGYCALRNAVEMVRRKSLSSDEILRAIYASHDEESNDLEECSAEEIYPDASTAPVTPRKRLPDPVGTPALKSWEKKSGTSRAESCRQATSTPGSYGGRRPSETVTQECAESYGVRRLSQASIRESLRSYFDQSPSQTRRPSLESSGRQRLSEIETLDSSGFGSSFDSPEKIRIGPVNFTNPLLAAAVAAKAAAAYQDEDKNCAPGYAFKRSDDKYKEESLQVCEGLNDSLPRYSSSPAGKAPLHEQSTFQSHTCTSTRSRDSYLSRGGFDADDSSSSASAIDVAAQLHRHAAANNDATCTWSGMLPQSCKDNPVYSCKVFLGGVPWDITPGLLSHAFKNFGQVRIEFPGNSTPRLGRGRPISGSPQCHGYVYAIFDNDRAVQQMLQACDRDVKEETYFFKLSGKKVQVIPWNVNDSNYICHSTTQRLDNETTVFVGALHGMLTAEGLARVMNDLFGNVVYAGIDTDKHKYPIGSGRVTFSSHKSYMKAVNAAFVEIKSSKFAKKVQIDPYLEESLCTTCKSCVGLYFCRNMTCFKYYCERCWVRAHNSMDPSTGVHKPLSRNSKNPNLASALRNTPEIKALQVGCVKDSMSAHRLQS